MGSRVKKIELDHFRGASRPSVIEFDPTKNTVVIFGENGRGKSTIVDAIDMVANGLSGSLEGRPSTTTRQHLPSIGSNHQDLKVRLFIDEMSWEASLNGSTIQVSGDNPCPPVHILRRNQLLKLIETQPAQRYETLRRFVDVDGVEQSEQHLRDCVRESKVELTSLFKQLTDAQNELEKLWKAEGSPDGTPLKWAQLKSNADVSEIEAVTSYLGSLIIAVNTLQGSKQCFDVSSDDYKSKVAILQGIAEEIKSTPGLSAEEAISLLNVLQQTQTYLSGMKVPLTECPVCEQPVDAPQLTDSISRRLTSMTKFEDIDRRKKAAEIQLESSKSTLSRDSAQFLQNAQKVIDKISDKKKHKIQGFAVDVETFAELSQEDMRGKAKLALCAKLADILNSNIEALRVKHADFQKDIHQHNAIKNHYNKILRCAGNALHVEKVYTALQGALEIIHAKRISFTQGILDEVAEECNRLYRRIHPNESLGNSTLSIDPSRKHSLHQGAEFEGHQNVPPQAYFSDSHLDTLGFCIWLSIAKRGTPQNSIVILDDVFTSVDSVHLKNIVKLLTDEAKNFGQVIIATHYRQWRDRYRLMQSASRNVHLIELHRWSLEQGVRACNSKLVLEELRDAIEKLPFDRRDVASRAGILLESIFDTLALQYRCRTRHTRNDDHTLRELSDSCSKLFGKLEIGKSPQLATLPLTAEQIRTAQEEEFIIRCPLGVFSGIKDSSFVRNQVGCHYNLSGMDISDDEVEQFGNDVLSLATAITCQNCGTIPGRDRGTHFGCPCGLTKIMPLTI